MTTVKELIKYLKTLDENAKVSVLEDVGDFRGGSCFT